MKAEQIFKIGDRVRLTNLDPIKNNSSYLLKKVGLDTEGIITEILNIDGGGRSYEVEFDGCTNINFNIRPDYLMLIQRSKVTFKYKIGDKVTSKKLRSPYYKIVTGLLRTIDDELFYSLDHTSILYPERDLRHYIEPNIIDLIKTFEDARIWCLRKGYGKDVIGETNKLLREELSPNLEAYLKLRIITSALNEGWEPTYQDEECRWVLCPSNKGIEVNYHRGSNKWYSNYFVFKSCELAEYARKQFGDIYSDFIGVKKGGEK